MKPICVLTFFFWLKASISGSYGQCRLVKVWASTKSDKGVCGDFLSKYEVKTFLENKKVDGISYHIFLANYNIIFFENPLFMSSIWYLIKNVIFKSFFFFFFFSSFFSRNKMKLKVNCKYTYLSAQNKPLDDSMWYWPDDLI